MALAFLQSVHYTSREVFDGDYPKDFQARLIHDLALTREERGRDGQFFYSAEYVASGRGNTALKFVSSDPFDIVLDVCRHAARHLYESAAESATSGSRLPPLQFIDRYDVGLRWKLRNRAGETEDEKKWRDEVAMEMTRTMELSDPKTTTCLYRWSGVDLHSLARGAERIVEEAPPSLAVAAENAALDLLHDEVKTLQEIYLASSKTTRCGHFYRNLGGKDRATNEWNHRQLSKVVDRFRAALEAEFEGVRVPTEPQWFQSTDQVARLKSAIRNIRQPTPAETVLSAQAGSAPLLWSRVAFFEGAAATRFGTSLFSEPESRRVGIV